MHAHLIDHACLIDHVNCIYSHARGLQYCHTQWLCKRRWLTSTAVRAGVTTFVRKNLVRHCATHVIQDFPAFHQRSSMAVKLVSVLTVERENSVQDMASKCPCKRDEQLQRGPTCDRRSLIPPWRGYERNPKGDGVMSSVELRSFHHFPWAAPNV